MGKELRNKRLVDLGPAMSYCITFVDATVLPFLDFEQFLIKVTSAIEIN